MGKKLRIFLGDLFILNEYSQSRTAIPLNIAYIASCAKEKYGDDCEVFLFKSPEKLSNKSLALQDTIIQPPTE